VGRRIVASLLTVVMMMILAACGTQVAPAPSSPATADKPATPAPVATPPDKVSLLFEWLPHGSHAPFFLGIEKGFYKDANLEVAIQDGAGSVKTVQTLGGGQNDFGFAMLAVMAMGRGQGMPLKAVAGLMQRNVFGVFVPKDSAIKSPKDLEGKSLLVTPGSVETLLLPAFLSKNGVDAAKVNITNVDPAAKVANYLAGKAEAMITDVAYASPTINPVRPSNTLDWADYGMVLPAFGIFTRDEMIQKNPELVRRFVQATLKSWEYSLENIDEAVAALMKNRPEKVKPEVAKQELELYKGFMQTERTKGKALGWQSSEDWQEALNLLKEHADLKGSTNPADFFMNDFLAN
jgi:NitT/TauT family transport system substrate-binding protein